VVQALVRLGEGRARPRCLLLHGNPGSLLDWEHLAPLLFETADVAAIDIPGFGRSPRARSGPEGMGLEELAEHAMAVADALSWREPFFLLGHSHGGGIAQVAAARHPERIAGLVLMGTLGAPAHRSYRLLSLPGAETIARLAGAMIRSRVFRPISRGILRRVMRDICYPELVSTERLDHELNVLSLRPAILVSMVHVTLGHPCEQLLASASAIRCPTLIVHGADDALVPVDCARAIHDRITNASGRSHFEVVPNAGHLLIHYQASDLARMILRHLGSWTAA
jgi:pimeloyl-ACP methyl ester carboxylesterase